MKRLTAVVHGHVQGVGYRWFVVRSAARLHLAGWVANEPDGTVSVVAEGTDEMLAELKRLLGEGPSGARVARVEGRLGPALGDMRGFVVRAAGHRGD